MYNVKNYTQIELIGKFEQLDKGDLHAPPPSCKGVV